MSSDSDEMRVVTFDRHVFRVPLPIPPPGADLLGDTPVWGWRCEFEKFLEKLPAARRLIARFVDLDDQMVAFKIQLLFKSTALCWFQMRYNRFLTLQNRVTSDMCYHLQKIERLRKKYDDMYDWAALRYYHRVPHDRDFSHWLDHEEPDILYRLEQPHWFYRDLIWRTRDPDRVAANWILLSSFVLVFHCG